MVYWLLLFFCHEILVLYFQKIKFWLRLQANTCSLHREIVQRHARLAKHKVLKSRVPPKGSPTSREAGERQGGGKHLEKIPHTTQGWVAALWRHPSLSLPSRSRESLWSPRKLLPLAFSLETWSARASRARPLGNGS